MAPGLPYLAADLDRCGQRHPPAVAEIGDLVLWTGRLAYANPHWKPGRRTAANPRAPEALAPGLTDISLVADAIHQATASIVAVAAADYTRTRTAAQAGQLLSPAETMHSGPAEHALFTRASRYEATSVLDAYRHASAQATSAIAEIATETQARNLAGPKTSRHLDPASTAAIAQANAGSEMPGPVERVLLEVGVTNPELINRGITIDKTASQLIDEAARETAALRWNTAVKRNKTIAATGKVIDHVLARGRPTTHHASRIADRRPGVKATGRGRGIAG